VSQEGRRARCQTVCTGLEDDNQVSDVGSRQAHIVGEDVERGAETAHDRDFVVVGLLGAIADGDIGKHFSPNDPRWRGASSDQFLKFAVERVNKRGGRIAHLDLTIVCEAPRIGPHRDAIRKRIAETAEMSIERVAVKATTSEQLGFTGRKEGIVAMATATVRLPWSW